MDEARRSFVEEYGVMFEQMGSTRMLGRVWAVLMVSDPPEMTAEEIAEALKASRGSISHATRQLIDLGVVQRVNKPGIRKDFYRVPRDAWALAFMTKMQSFGHLLNLFKRGLDAMDGASDEAQAPLRDAIEFYEFWQREMAELPAKWKQYKEGIHA